MGLEERYNPRHIERIKKMGTPEQKKEMEEYLMKKSRIDKKKPLPGIMNVTYVQETNTPKGSSDLYGPARVAFWHFYKGLIGRETGGVLNMISQGVLDVMEDLIKYLIGDPSGRWNSDLDLYLWGDVGVSKTTLARAGKMMLDYLRGYMKKELLKKYKFISMEEVFFSAYSSGTLKGIENIVKGDVCIDELSERHMSYKHFGNDLNLMNDILMLRHNLWKQRRARTMITTNIPPSKLKEIVNDERLYHRIRQQYKTVEIIGEDQRIIAK